MLWRAKFSHAIDARIPKSGQTLIASGIYVLDSIQSEVQLYHIMDQQ